MNVEDSNCVTNSCCGEKADELVEEFGYDAPEAWRNSSVATWKGDVYSFRILVLEIITRRASIVQSRQYNAIVRI